MVSVIVKESVIPRQPEVSHTQDRPYWTLLYKTTAIENFLLSSTEIMSPTMDRYIKTSLCYIKQGEKAERLRLARSELVTIRL